MCYLFIYVFVCSRNALSDAYTKYRMDIDNLLQVAVIFHNRSKKYVYEFSNNIHLG